MPITAALVKELREKTGIGIMKCKEALKASDGDLEKAVEYLRKQGLAAAERKAGRATSEGIIASYIHSNDRLGVLLELRCETDFAARGEDFQRLGRDLCMQVAASRPRYVSPEDVPQEVIEKETEIYREQFKDKPERALAGIVQGKIKSFYKDVCLLEQPFIKEPKQSVGDVIKAVVAKIGENITVARFVRLEVGE